MLSLLMPIYRVDFVPMSAKFAGAALLLFLCLANLRRGYCQVMEKWRRVSDPMRAGNVDVEKRTVEWERIQKLLRFEADIFVPGIPYKVTRVLSFLLLFSMLAGLNLRSAFPLLAAFSWGLPCALFGSFFFQLIGNRLAEASAIDSLQKELSIEFKVRR
jgi:hypothetical protein